MSRPQSISVGFVSYPADFLLDGYRPGRPTEYDYANKGFAGALCISYKYKVSRSSYIGVTETIEQEHGDWLDNEIPGGNVFELETKPKGLFVRTAFTTAVDFTHDYLKTDFCRIYLTTGLGITYELETDQYNPDFYAAGYFHGFNTYGAMRQRNNKSHMNVYASPFGISAGRKLCYFLELGFGYRGIVNTGLSYRF